MIRKRIKIRGFKAATVHAQPVGKVIANFIPNKQRRFRVYCIGLPRSGTHSIANLFRTNFRADHEPYAGSTVKVIENMHRNRISSSKIIDHLLIRDKILQLEMESTHYLYRFVPQLVTLFPDSKFIMTVREPKSWLESEMNKNYQSVKGRIWSRLETIRYGIYNNKHQNDSLKNIKGIYPVSSYLQYYRDHIEFVIKHVPEKRLMVLDTFTLQENINTLCDFIDVESYKLNLEKIHSAKRKVKEIQLNKLVDESVIHESIDKYCRPFIEEKTPFLLKYMN